MIINMPAPIPELGATPQSPPFALPRFTFLISGSVECRKNFTTLLMNRDAGLAPIYLSEPATDAAVALFFGGYRIDTDTSDLAVRNAKLFETRSDDTLADYIAHLDRDLINRFGVGIRAELAIRRWLEGDSPYFDRFIIPDLDSTYDATVFISRFGRQNCLTLALDTLPPFFPDGKHIWLAAPSYEAKFEELEKEIGLISLSD